MKRLLTFALALGILLMAPQFARATNCTINWTGNAGDGQWTTKGNWDTNQLPGPADDVCINNAASVTASSAGITIDSLSLLGTLAITNSAGVMLTSKTITSILTNLTVNGNSALTITGSATFPGSVTLGSISSTPGTIQGNNSTGTGTATFSGAVQVVYNSALTVPTINNGGSINITQPNVQFALGGGMINNQKGGAINIQADGVTINASGSFNNAGTFSKSGTTGSSNLNMSGIAPFNNTGTVVAQSGTLVLNLSQDVENPSTGAFNANAGAVLRFAAGEIILNAKTIFEGSGTLEITGSVWTVSAPIVVNTANLIFDGSINTLVLGSSTLTLNSAMTTWNGGDLALSGTGAKVTLNPGKTMLITTASFHDLSCDLDIFGTVNQNTAVLSQDLNLNNSNVTIEHGAKFNLLADGGVHGSGTISDLGTFAKTGGTGVSNVDYNGTFTVTTVGTVAVDNGSGTLNFANSSGGTFNGSSTVGSAATLQFSAGTYAIGGEFTGSGTALISSVGSWNLQGFVLVDTGVFQLNGVAGSSLIQGVGDLKVNSKKFNFTGGRMTGTGTITIPAGVTLSISTASGLDSVYILGQTVSNSGVAQITDSSLLYLGSGVTWTNETQQSEFTFQGDGEIVDNGGGVTFNNNGKVQKTGGTNKPGSYIVFVGTFNNNASGSVNAAAGALNLSPTTGMSSGTMDHPSTFTAANNGAVLRFYMGQWTIGADTKMTGKGTIHLYKATWNLAAALTVNSAIFRMDSSSSGAIPTVNGAFDFILASPSIQLGSGLRHGVLQNGKPTGTIIIDNAASAPQVTVFRPFTIDACTMENFGVMTINSFGAVTTRDGAVLLNELEGTMTLDAQAGNNAAVIVNNSVFMNYGKLTLGTESGANGVQTIGGTNRYSNYGTIEYQKGYVLKSVNGYDEHGTTTLNAGTLTTDGPLSIFNGTLEGPGTVGGLSIDDILGKIKGGQGGKAPDNSRVGASLAVGVLNLSLPLTIESGGTMIAVLNGTKPGTQYDQINSTSSVALGGTLNLQFGNGFSPSPSNSFTILTFASSTGSFASVVTPSSTCAAKLTATSTSLSVAFTSSSVSVAISPTRVTLAENAQQQFTDTVTNGCGNGVTWKVAEGAAGGTITTAGLYTAPAATGTFHVVVTSVADPTKSATATVTVTAAAGKNLSVTPQAGVVQPGGSVHFAASQSVTWSVAEGTAGGRVSAAGIYAAPRKPGLYHVIAASTTDATSRAVVNIAVVSGKLKSAYVANLEQNSISVLTASNLSTQGSGPLRETESVATGQSPAALAISPQGLLLTANRDSNDVSAFAVAGATLQPVVGPALEAGTGPTAVAWDPSGRLAFVINAGSEEVSIFSAQQTSGQLSYLGKQALDAGDRPGAVAVHPSAPFVFVADAGGNNIQAFTYDMAGMLKTMSGSPFAAGTGPAAAAIDPAGKFLFVANRRSGDVSVFAIDGPNETLHEVSGSPFVAGKGPAAIVTDVTGSYLFVANHQSKSISTFWIDSETGALTPLSQTALPIQGPTALAADPSDRYLFVANDTTGGVLNLTVDVATGTLTPAGLTAGPGKASAIVLVGDRDAQAP